MSYKITMAKLVEQKKGCGNVCEKDKILRKDLGVWPKEATGLYAITPRHSPTAQNLQLWGSRCNPSRRGVCGWKEESIIKKINVIYFGALLYK